jgi:chromosomal replication initiator protein
MLNFIRAIKAHDTMEFKNSFRSVDILMIDDFQFMGGKDSTQEEFFHTFVSLISQKKQLVVSADKPPSELAGIEDRLRSRLGGGLVVNIHPPTYELRLGILEQKLKQNGKEIDGEIVKLIAENVRTNVRELEGALMRICAQIEFFGREMTLESARSILSDMFSKSMPEVTDKRILETVSLFYGLEYSDIFSQSRLKKIVKARQVAMFLCREINKRSLPEIGRLFGGKDHTTALYGIKKIDSEMSAKPPVRDEMNSIRQKLGR